MKDGQIQVPSGGAGRFRSARSGAKHWLIQRVTAIVVAPLTIWFTISFVRLSTGTHEAYLEWLGAPLNAALMTLFIVVLFCHMALGLQVIAEDYLHRERTREFAVMLIQFGCLMLALISIFSILIRCLS